MRTRHPAWSIVMKTFVGSSALAVSFAILAARLDYLLIPLLFGPRLTASAQSLTHRADASMNFVALRVLTGDPADEVVGGTILDPSIFHARLESRRSSL